MISLKYKSLTLTKTYTVSALQLTNVNGEHNSAPTCLLHLDSHSSWTCPDLLLVDEGCCHAAPELSTCIFTHRIQGLICSWLSNASVGSISGLIKELEEHSRAFEFDIKSCGTADVNTSNVCIYSFSLKSLRLSLGKEKPQTIHPIFFF